MSKSKPELLAEAKERLANALTLPIDLEDPTRPDLAKKVSSLVDLEENEVLFLSLQMQQPASQQLIGIPNNFFNNKEVKSVDLGADFLVNSIKILHRFTNP